MRTSLLHQELATQQLVHVAARKGSCAPTICFRSGGDYGARQTLAQIRTRKLWDWRSVGFTGGTASPLFHGTDSCGLLGCPDRRKALGDCAEAAALAYLQAETEFQTALLALAAMPVAPIDPRVSENSNG